RRHHDRHSRRGAPCTHRCWSAPSNDRVHAEPEQFFRDVDISLGGALGPTIFQPQVLSLNVAKFTKTLAQTLDCRERERRDYPDRHRPRWPGRTSDVGQHRPEPPRRRAAQQRDDLAPLHAMPSSARTKNVSEIARPSVLAVLRLTMSANFVGCSIGRSAGLAPLRMRSPKYAARRYRARMFTP